MDQLFTKEAAAVSIEERERESGGENEGVRWRETGLPAMICRTHDKEC